MSIKYLQAQFPELIADGVYGNKTHSAVIKALSAGKDVRLSANFTLNDLIYSETANSLKIDNTPPADAVKNLIELVDSALEPICKALGYKLTVTSGYRSWRLNSAVRGSKTSVHPLGLACDWRCPEYGDTFKIITDLPKKLAALGVKFDQLIIENRHSPKSWIHIGLKSNRGEKRMRVMSLTQK